MRRVFTVFMLFIIIMRFDISAAARSGRTDENDEYHSAQAGYHCEEIELAERRIELARYSYQSIAPSKVCSFFEFIETALADKTQINSMLYINSDKKLK